jgi:hypothetical protein
MIVFMDWEFRWFNWGKATFIARKIKQELQPYNFFIKLNINITGGCGLYHNAILWHWVKGEWIHCMENVHTPSKWRPTYIYGLVKMFIKTDSNDVGENYMLHRSFSTSLVLNLKLSYSELNINIIFALFLHIHV